MSEDAKQVRVLIVGAGFSGIGAAISLMREGIEDFVVLEKATEVGGTWRENTYPGCACDVPSALYSFSFAPSAEWSHAYGRQAEIQDYVCEVTDRFGVRPKVVFGTEALDSSWDEETKRWIVKTNNGTWAAQVLIGAAGPLHDPAIPDLPGIASFEGKTFHSANWDHDHDLAGERVAVVGTGASAIQFVPRIQPEVGHLTLFQRTAPWVLPKPDRKIPGLEQAINRRFPTVQKLVRGGIYYASELVQLAQRRPKVMEKLHRIGLSHLRREIKDPELRAALTPRFTLGCKRILLSNDYYRSLVQPNATVVARGVEEIRPRSIVDSGGDEHEVDTIIFGTGFHATDPPLSRTIRGRDGRSLAETWEGSPEAYLGTTIAGFPNAFLLIGPNLGNGHSSAIVLIEAQLEYVMDALRTMDERGLQAVEVRPGVQREWNAKVQEALQGTVWNAGGCKSYYIDRNGRNAAIYPWTTIDLRRRTRRFDLAEYASA